jgi:5-formyltetrahydrofolate cyclo-ligase
LFFALLGCVLPAQQLQQSFRIQPLRPVSELRADAFKAQPPQEQGEFLKPDLVELIKLDPTLKPSRALARFGEGGGHATKH